MHDYLVSLIAYGVTALLVFLGTFKTLRLGKQWRRPLGPLLRLGVVFVLLHFLFADFGVSAEKGYGFVVLFFVASLGSFVFGELALFPIMILGASMNGYFGFQCVMSPRSSSRPRCLFRKRWILRSWGWGGFDGPASGRIGGVLRGEARGKVFPGLDPQGRTGRGGTGEWERGGGPVPRRRRSLS